MGYLERNWSIIEEFYHWLLKESFSKFESGSYCKYIATFFDLYLKKFFFEDVELDGIDIQQVKGYIGYWYPVYASFGSVEDIKFQIKSLSVFSKFIEDRNGSDLSEVISFLKGEEKIIKRFKRYKKIERENIDFKKYEMEFEEWLKEKW